MKHLEIIAYFKSLNSEDQHHLANHLLEHINATEHSLIAERNSQIAKSGLICPNCQSKHVVGYGKYQNAKRYKCQDCKRTFNSLTGSMAHWIHKKDLLKQYIYFMLQGYSLRKISAELNICLKTSFDWRHKILNSLSQEGDIKLSGVVEADETFFLYSEKGNKNLDGRKARKRGGKAGKKGINKDHVAVLTAYERKSGTFTNSVICRGRITKKAIEKGLGEKLNKQESILCVDSHKSYEGFAMDNQINVKRIFVRRKEFVIEKIYHIQHVNNIHSNMKYWMFKFHGVSTKYLQNYMNYFTLVKKIGFSIDKAEKAMSILLQHNNVFIKRNNINQQICIT